MTSILFCLEFQLDALWCSIILHPLKIFLAIFNYRTENIAHC